MLLLIAEATGDLTFTKTQHERFERCRPEGDTFDF